MSERLPGCGHPPAPGADALAEMGDGLRVAEKVVKAHGLSLGNL